MKILISMETKTNSGEYRHILIDDAVEVNWDLDYSDPNDDYWSLTDNVLPIKTLFKLTGTALMVDGNHVTKIAGMPELDKERTLLSVTPEAEKKILNQFLPPILRKSKLPKKLRKSFMKDIAWVKCENVDCKDRKKAHWYPKKVTKVRIKGFSRQCLVSGTDNTYCFITRDELGIVEMYEPLSDHAIVNFGHNRKVWVHIDDLGGSILPILPNL